jgi:hypothetical protein
MQHVRGTGEVYIGYWWRNLREREHFEGPGVDGRIILRLVFRKWNGGGGVWTGLIGLRVGTGGGLLYML